MLNVVQNQDVLKIDAKLANADIVILSKSHWPGTPTSLHILLPIFGNFLQKRQEHLWV